MSSENAPFFVVESAKKNKIKYVPTKNKVIKMLARRFQVTFASCWSKYQEQPCWVSAEQAGPNSVMNGLLAHFMALISDHHCMPPDGSNNSFHCICGLLSLECNPIKSLWDVQPSSLQKLYNTISSTWYDIPAQHIGILYNPCLGEFTPFWSYLQLIYTIYRYISIRK